MLIIVHSFKHVENLKKKLDRYQIFTTLGTMRIKFGYGKKEGRTGLLSGAVKHQGYSLKSATNPIETSRRKS